MILVSGRNECQEALKLAKEKGVNFVFVVYHKSDKEYAKYKDRFGNFFSRESLELDNEIESERADAFFISPTIASKILKVSHNKMTKDVENFEKGKSKAFRKIKSKKVNYKVDFDI